jgi:biopolymer transport protein TolR
MAWKRRARQKSSSQATVSLTPLIDTALTLLVIFMVATPMMHRGIKVDLPKGNVNEVQNASQQKDIVVYLDRSGHIFANGDAVAKQELIPLLQKIANNQPNKMVVVKADQGVEWGAVHSLVEMIKGVGGITSVVLASQKPDRS